MAELELEIQKLVAGGRGLARTSEGQVALVSGALPGERVRAAVEKRQRDYLLARTVELLRVSPERTDPPCPLYGRCGGCDFMHLEHAAQVAAKSAWLAETLGRAGVELAPQALPSPRVWGFRHRLRFQVQEGRLGFFAAASHGLVPLEHCPVAAPAVNRVLPALARGLAALPGEAGRALTGVEVLAGEGEDADVFLLVLGDRPSPPSRRTRAALAAWAREAGAAGLRVAWGPGGRRRETWPLTQDHTILYWSEGDMGLRAVPGLFCQVNFGANRRLIQAVREAAQGAPPGPALDLYAGSGNFSLPLAAAGRRVEAVERVYDALEALAWQAETQGLAGRLDRRQADSVAAVSELVRRGRRFPLVVLDPPREGARDLLPALWDLEPRRVIYVSCHPAALARDAARFLQQGFQAVGLSQVDMFPHTGHTEAVLVLERA
ncbi:MAG: TRAM domain-containing protein [Deltaproteobacteria bacterium]|nr:TRAM domain-containing protein [Deltaproteobacteria bacterium]